MHQANDQRIDFERADTGHMIQRNQKLFLSDILECIDLINDYLKKTTREEFFNDFIRKDAVFRRLEIIGEAAKNVSPRIKKKHPEIPWPQICGMRNKLVHEYFGVNYKKVWQTATEDLVPLKKQIEAILKEERL